MILNTILMAINVFGSSFDWRIQKWGSQRILVMFDFTPIGPYNLTKGTDFCKYYFIWDYRAYGYILENTRCL